MTRYWTEDDYRAALQRMHGPAAIVGPIDSVIYDARPVVQLSEKAFMAAVVRLAVQQGWKVYHPFDSRKSAPGYPDLTMAKPGRPVIFAELKLEGEKPTIEQEAWLETLRQATNTHVYLWRPSDWPQITEVLSHET